MSTKQKIIRAKVGPFELAKRFGHRLLLVQIHALADLAISVHELGGISTAPVEHKVVRPDLVRPARRARSWPSGRNALSWSLARHLQPAPLVTPGKLVPR